MGKGELALLMLQLRLVSGGNPIEHRGKVLVAA